MRNYENEKIVRSFPYETILSPVSAVEIFGASLGRVAVSGVDENGEVVLLYVGDANWRFSSVVRGFAALRIETDDLASVTVIVEHRQRAEPTDDRALPVRPERKSVLSKLRDRARAEMARARPELAELPGYELPDGEDDLFEEDYIAMRSAMTAPEGTLETAAPEPQDSGAAPSPAA